MNRLYDALTKVARQLKVSEISSHPIEISSNFIAKPRSLPITSKPPPPITKKMVRLNYRSLKAGVGLRKPQNSASLQSKRGCVNSKTIPASSPYDLRGIVTKLSFLIPPPLRNIHPPTIYTRFFNITFYPVDHPLSLTRKSKPAVLVRYNSNDYLNYSYPPAEFASLKNKLARYNGAHNISTFSYSVCRKRASTLVKRCFWKFVKVGVPQNLQRVDGLYMFYIKQFPSSKEEMLLFERNMGTSLTQILKSDYNSPRNPHHKKIMAKKFSLSAMKRMCGLYSYDKLFIHEAEKM